MLRTHKNIFFLAVIVAVVAVSTIATFFFLRGNKIEYDASVPRGEESQQALDPDIYHAPAAAYPRGLSLIFLADGYLSWNEFDRDTDTMLRALKSTEPWSSYKRYNIYRILPKETGLCSVETANERKPVLRCAPGKINAYLGNLTTGPFKLVVLSRRDFQSWANVVRLTDSGIFMSVPRSPQGVADEGATGVLFLHLVGHAFGLKDEEIFPVAKAHSAVMRPDGPNCAPDKETAKVWWGDLIGAEPAVGYFKGCSGNRDYIKPTEHSLMNLGNFSLDALTYGPVSEEYLSKVLRYCFAEKLPDISDDPNFFAQYQELAVCAQ